MALETNDSTVLASAFHFLIDSSLRTCCLGFPDWVAAQPIGPAFLEKIGAFSAFLEQIGASVQRLMDMVDGI